MRLISENNELFEEYTRHLFGIKETAIFRHQLLRLIGQLFQTDHVSLLFLKHDKPEEYSEPKGSYLNLELLPQPESLEALKVYSEGSNWPAFLSPLRREGIKLLVSIPVLQHKNAAVILGWKNKLEIVYEEEAEIRRLKDRLDELLSFYELLAQNQQLKEKVSNSASPENDLPQLFLSTFPGLLFLFDEDGRLLKWNPRAENLLGYTAQEFAKMPLLLLFPQEERMLSEKIIAEAFRTGYASMENKMLTKGGIARSFLFMLHGHQSGGQQLLLLQGIDISHSKQLEGSLRKISNHLRHIINNDILCYIKWNKDFEVLDWSAKTAETFGWPKQEVKGRHMLSFDFMHPDDKETASRLIAELQQGHTESGKHELRHLTRNGRTITIEWYTTAIKDEQGRITSFLSLGNETTTRNHMEHDLLETNQKLEALLTSSPVSIVTFDISGRIQSWNKAAEQIFGYTEEEVLGRRAPYIPEDKKEDFLKLANTVKEGNNVTDLVVHRKRKDQSDLLLKVNVAPIRDKDGNVSGIVAVQEDVTEQERLKEKLNEEKVYRESILENLQSLIIACDAEGRINLYNSAARDHLKADPAGAVPENWGKAIDLYTADGSRKLQGHEMPLYKALKEGTVRDEELMMVTKEGVEKLFSCNASPILDSRGQHIGALLSMEDITEKKASLREFFSEKEFSDAILSSLPGVFYVINTSGRFVRWNNRFSNISQFSGEEISRLAAVDFIAPEDRLKVAAAISEVFERGEARVEASFLTKNGRKIPYLFTGHSFWKNGEHYLVGMGIDVSERKAAEESRERIVSILEATSDFVGIFGQGKQCLYLNAEGMAVCGITAVENMSLYDCCPEWMSDMIDQEIIPVADERGIWRGEAALLHKNGREIPVSLVLIAHDSDGNTYYSMIARDISHHLLYEKKLTEQNEELKKINAELDRFVYSASHDLRAPLVSILGLINIARLSPNPQEFPQYLDLMENRVDRLDTFIRDIEDFSRNSRLSVKQEIVDFDAVIEESRDSLKFTKGAEQVSLTKEIRVEAPFYSDKSRLMIVMNNLISNAIRYSDPEKKESYIRIRVEADEEKATIQVEDNGLGIAQQYLDKIFDMFFRASATNVGSGLGLFIVKETIEKLKGEIRVSSSLGDYTIFTIVLPNLKPAV